MSVCGKDTHGSYGSKRSDFVTGRKHGNCGNIVQYFPTILNVYSTCTLV